MPTEHLPIIVGGCHRSGTTMLRRVLDAHSRIYCGPEVKFFRDFYGDYFYDPLKRDRFATTARSVVPEDELFDLLGKAFVALHERAAAQAGKARWADKTPENVVYLAAWERLLASNWVFIHLVRNPLDTLASFKEMEFNDAMPLNLEARIAFYKRYTQAGLEFGSRQPRRYRRILYEELATRPEAVVRELMEWLGEPFEPGQLHVNEASHQRGLEDPKVEATNQIHEESVGRWKMVLTRDEAEEIAADCAPVWGQIDLERKWAPTSEELAQACGKPISMRPPDELPSMSELSQISSILAQERFELDNERVAYDRWIKELLQQIEIRDRELGRIKGLLPVRAALALKHALKL
jgi:hypothetical protein